MNIEQDPNPDKSPAGGVLRRFFRWLFCWRVASRGLFVLACLATLIGLFYAVENWRGKRAWEQCRRELEARGAVIDWNALIPPPVPDEQNLFKAPKMMEWFVKKAWKEVVLGAPSQSPDTNAPFTVSTRAKSNDLPVLVATVDVVPSDGPLPLEIADAALRIDDPAANARAATLLRQSIAPCAQGALRYILIARPLDQIKPAHLVVHSDTAVTAKELYSLLPRSPLAANIWNPSEAADLQVIPVGTNAFRVSLTPSVYTAAEYLDLSQAAVPDLEVLRQALQRPCARMDSDYQRPFERPIPNFVRMRTVAQILCQRAQCYLLLGKSEAAWHELSLVRDLCHMLEAKPASDCPTLVEAMISVAITGIYTQVIADGLRLRAWQEPELAALQKQLAEVKLLPLVRKAFNAERAASCRTLEAYPRAQLVKLFASGKDRRELWEEFLDPTFLFLTFAPRGWCYQNMCTDALLEELVTRNFDVAHDQILPREADDIGRQLEALRGTFRPYTFLMAMAIPNFVKAEQTVARNQSLANEAFIACGLERYRLAHGQYPDALDALVPQFADKVPNDIVGGQPLKYRCNADGHYLLYSVGWNDNDDGGVPEKPTREGDWVWPSAR